MTSDSVLNSFPFLLKISISCENNYSNDIDRNYNKQGKPFEYCKFCYLQGIFITLQNLCDINHEKLILKIWPCYRRCFEVTNVIFKCDLVALRGMAKG